MSELVIELTPMAEKDILAAVEWYDAHAPTVGDQFIERLHELFEQVGRNPLIYVEVVPGVRRGLLKQFPYAVYYQPRDNTLLVVAVLHTSRHPDYWNERNE